MVKVRFQPFINQLLVAWRVTDWSLMTLTVQRYRPGPQALLLYVNVTTGGGPAVAVGRAGVEVAEGASVAELVSVLLAAVPEDEVGSGVPLLVVNAIAV